MKSIAVYYTIDMKKRHGIWLKISLVSTITIVTAILFSVALLEPNIKIRGWESLDETKLVKTEKTLNFIDSNGEYIADTVYDANRSHAKLSEIPQHTIDAFVSIEDKRFFKHHGVDYIRIGGAIIDNIKSFSFKEGASTISQQLIKNTHLSSDKKISRKIKEIRIAKELERKYTKEEILEMYLNILYFGDNLYGITTAARVFFDTDPSNLSLSQSALIAGIINNPARYNPYQNPDSCIKRRNLVLKAMLDNDKIDRTQYDSAIAEPLAVERKNHQECQYLNSVIKDAREILNLSKKQLLSKRLTIATYYEKDLNDALTDIVKNAEIPQDCDAHITVMSNASGKIIGDASRKKTNLSYLKRQPGSTIKPLISYAPAIEKGDIYCCSPIYDAPEEFGDYKPANYRNKYYGWVDAKEALSRSLNIPAVRLLKTCGIDYAKNLCSRLGITFADSDDNLALALGGMTEGVTLRQLVDAYGTFARSGKFIEGSCIRYISDEGGNIIYSDKRQSSAAISEDTAFLVSTMLKECALSGTANALSGFGNVCAKTGTVGNSDGNSDVYCIAYTPKYTIGVWVGGNKMPNETTASNTACPIAKKALKLLCDDTNLPKPESIKCRYIDSRALKEKHVVLLAGNDVKIKDKACEWFSEKHMPKEYSTSQYGDYLYYDELLNLDFDNFEIIEGLLD